MPRTKGAKGKKYSKKECQKFLVVSKTKKSKATVAGPKKEKSSVAKALAIVAERKIQPLTSIHMKSPYPQALIADPGPVYYRNFLLGTSPSAWTGPIGSIQGQNYDALGGYVFPQGTGSNSRIGKYMFLERCHMNMCIALSSAASRNTQPTQFRILLYKFRRNLTLGEIGNPSENLFINSAGETIGVKTYFDNSGSPGSASFTFMNAIVNKKNYTVYKDEKFVLTPQTTIAQGGAYVPLSHSGAIQKDFQFVLNHNEKTAFDAASKPVDLQYQYAVTILSAPMGDLDQLGNNDWSVSVRGTVSALDS